MPKSKRNKVVTLAKTTTKGKEGKHNLVTQIHSCLEDFTYLYVFSVNNMRTQLLKEVRAKWISSRFFFGKNKVMQIALGRSPEDEVKEKLHLVSENVVGNCGLFFTTEPEEKVLSFFKNYKEIDYARAGFAATINVALEKGPCEQFVHSMEPYLRTQLGMPTSLKNGVVHLEKDFQVCTVGDELTPEQAKLLKLLDTKMSEFSFDVTCVWSGGKFKKF